MTIESPLKPPVKQPTNESGGGLNLDPYHVTMGGGLTFLTIGAGILATHELSKTPTRHVQAAVLETTMPEAPKPNTLDDLLNKTQPISIKAEAPNGKIYVIKARNTDFRDNESLELALTPGTKIEFPLFEESILGDWADHSLFDREGFGKVDANDLRVVPEAEYQHTAQLSQVDELLTPNEMSQRVENTTSTTAVTENNGVKFDSDQGWSLQISNWAIGALVAGTVLTVAAYARLKDRWT